MPIKLKNWLVFPLLIVLFSLIIGSFSQAGIPHYFTVLYSDGCPVEGARITVYKTYPTVTCDGYTDENGKFYCYLDECNCDYRVIVKIGVIEKWNGYVHVDETCTPTDINLSDSCPSGHCVDGYCCDSECDLPDQSCNMPGKEGICTPKYHIVNQTDPACTTGNLYYSTIQSAVNAASSGDDVIVCPGTYNEWVDVFKSLTVRSNSGNPMDTIVNRSGSGDYAGFEIDADNVNISGFTVTGFTGYTLGIINSGILVYQSEHANISNNNLINNEIGIKLKFANYSIVENNNISSNADYGIWLGYNSNNNTVRFNIVSGNRNKGIALGEDDTVALNNIIEFNNIFDPVWMNFFNGQTNAVEAKYNWWGTTTCSLIDSKIYDDDESSFGKVDFSPPLDGPYPTGSPVVEICDGIDNDCDGVIDEEPEASASCPLCQNCSLGSCSNVQQGTDPKDDCPGDLCVYDYCDGNGACENKPDTTDCGICASCDGLGSCVGNLTQDEDCDSCWECSGLSACSYVPTGQDPKNNCIGNCDNCDGSGSCAPFDALCTGNCDYCSGSGTNYNCVADEDICETLYKCSDCTGSGTSFNCTYAIENDDCPATICPDSCDIDSNPFTFDHANDELNYCLGLDQCTSNSCNYNYTCADLDTIDGIFNWESIIRTCTASCDEHSDCGNKCVGEVRYYSGSCNALCNCSYSTEDCNTQDGCYAYDTGCEDRDYYCQVAGCNYSYSNRHTDYSDAPEYYCKVEEVWLHTRFHDFYCNGLCSDHTSWIDEIFIEDCNDRDCSEPLTCSGIGTDTIQETGDDYTCSGWECSLLGTKVCGGSWTCNSGSECSSQSCVGSDRYCYYDNGYKWNNSYPSTETSCSDSYDNDCDGCVDSVDSNCGGTDTVCNGIDDDCDGSVDEDYVPYVTYCGVGVCQFNGVMACENGVEFDTCIPGEPTGDDTDCDGLDDNCNGLTDEHYIPTPTECGLGVCYSTGYLECISGSLQDNCTQNPPTGDDTDCDGLDDNCNGQNDENYVPYVTQCGIGVCYAEGIMVCENGVEVDYCHPGDPTEDPEVSCEDGEDNDCDGLTDYNDSDCITVDIEPPQWSDNKTYPESPAEYHSDATYTFNINWTDNVAVDEVILEMDGVNYTVTGTGTYSMTFSTCTYGGGGGGRSGVPVICSFDPLIIIELYKLLTMVTVQAQEQPCLSAGNHTYRWYAKDTSNNWNFTDVLDFTINKPDPLIITITSPKNTTYSTNSVNLIYSVYSTEPVDWKGYSLDNQSYVTLTGSTTLTGLSEGSHNVIVFSNNTLGVWNYSELVYFTVSIQKPDLIVEDIWTSGSTIYYRIRNQGNANSGYSYSRLYVDGYYKTYDYVPSLTANAYSNEYFSYSWICSGYSDSIQVCADGYGYVSESNEYNNCRAETFNCPTTCTCTAWMNTYDCCPGSRWPYLSSYWTRTCSPSRCDIEVRCVSTRFCWV